jgi:mRNA-degrading endonuclease RelE of RelBE toxin-antitoxin system
VNVRHKATPRFWECYRRLPNEVQKQADKCYELLKQNPKHPSLHLKKVGRFWSVRIGASYRALAVEQDENLLWFWIGTHSEYDQLLGRE